MSLGQRIFSVPSAASLILLGGGEKISAILFSLATVRFYHPVLSVFSITEMLGRAAKDYDSGPSKRNQREVLLHSSNRTNVGNIEDQFRKVGKPSYGPKSPQSNTLQKIYSNKPSFLKLDYSNNQNTVSAFPGQRSYSTSNSLFSVLSKQNSFQDLYSTTNMKNMSSLCMNLKNGFVDFNEDDFDEDDDLDLDFQNELPNTPQNLRQTLSKSSNFTGTRGNSLNLSQDKPSSAITWPSSSPSHQLPPLLTDLGTKRESEDTNFEDSSQPVRPMKRRTLPWLQKQAENESEQISENYRVNEDFSQTNSTPKPNQQRIKNMPWDNTGSAIKEEKKKLKERQRVSKINGESMEDSEKQEKLQAKLSVTPISLSDEQKRVLDLVINYSKSVFFTGSAGTGKSVLMRAIIAELRKRYSREPDRVAVTASTGLAACNIGGVTLHSFGGIGLGKDDIPALVRKIKRNQKAKLRWLRTKVLIIDEVSMVDGELFDKLEGIARALRNNGRPFGGIQLVITGDFFQLPPVPEYDNRTRGIKFAFDAGTWSTSIHHTIGLTQVFRQKDPQFANMLNEMRLGKITENTVATFKSLSRSVSSEGYEATELFPTRKEVENSNAVRMKNLQGASYKYVARDGGSLKDENFREKLLSNMMAPKILELKKGAQVMLIKNMDDGLVNGTIGKVRSFMSEKDFKFRGDTDSGREELQGFSDEESSDEQVSTRDLKAISKFSKLDSTLDVESGTLYPYVSFKLLDGTRRMMLILPEEWKIELPNGEVQAFRAQVPLILAWALSIHKAQGQTLPRVKIDLKRIFEKGQAYVALSRATTKAGLQVLNFDKSKVLAHPRVAQFYHSLYTANNVIN